MALKELSTTSSKKFSEEEIKFIKFLYNELRKSSVIWDGRKEILRLCRKKVLVRRTKDGRPVYKLKWQCAKCQKWKNSEKEMEVDHIVEIGGYTGFTGDWNETIRKIFPTPVEDHLQALCISCHLRKTNEFTSALKKWTRKERR